jgi:hypothetical protein
MEELLIKMLNCFETLYNEFNCYDLLYLEDFDGEIHDSINNELGYD